MNAATTNRLPRPIDGDERAVVAAILADLRDNDVTDADDIAGVLADLPGAAWYAFGETEPPPVRWDVVEAALRDALSATARAA